MNAIFAIMKRSLKNSGLLQGLNLLKSWIFLYIIDSGADSFIDL